MKSRNATLIPPMTASTRERKAKVMPALKRPTATIQTVRIRLQRSSEPSCAPHTAAIR